MPKSRQIKSKTINGGIKFSARKRLAPKPHKKDIHKEINHDVASTMVLDLRNQPMAILEGRIRRNPQEPIPKRNACKVREKENKIPAPMKNRQRKLHFFKERWRRVAERGGIPVARPQRKGIAKGKSESAAG
ncbi:MAG: hypothetical protein HFE73_04620 [Firmicutes bacterium]|nr:hypothetical protein [Bacillota bacterium]